MAKGERTGIRLLLAAVVGMGVLIVVGVAVLVATVVSRLSTPPAQAAATLEEPAGTRMGMVTGSGDRLAVLLTGGGPDRVVLVDPRTGRVTGRIGLAR